MTDPSSQPQRKVAIADHIWKAFEEMASQMGSDRDALINQAMFMFARLNGFLDTSGGSTGRGAGADQHTPVPKAAAAVAQAPQRPAPPVAAPPQMKPAAAAPRPPPPVPPPAPEPPSGSMDDDPVRREVQERVLETAAELERLIKAKNQANTPPAPPPPDRSSEEGEDDMGGVDVEDSQSDGGGSPALYLTLEGGELDRISKDRFIIGRGKHCDFVINSGKVSREHAVIVRDNNDFFLEDLGSSNGTWFNKQRIKRRKIEDGDEYFICSERVKFVYR